MLCLGFLFLIRIRLRSIAGHRCSAVALRRSVRLRGYLMLMNDKRILAASVAFAGFVVLLVLIFVAHIHNLFALLRSVSSLLLLGLNLLFDALHFLFRRLLRVRFVIFVLIRRSGRFLAIQNLLQIESTGILRVFLFLGLQLDNGRPIALQLRVQISDLILNIKDHVLLLHRLCLQMVAFHTQIIAVLLELLNHFVLLFQVIL
mmetsp:Transcript_21180/g.33856  ORF Transcript_21180/g.33856 Transcript_21180/m.33856 type:complete len:203 (+) Transcript_21180:662-1270(+)